MPLYPVMKTHKIFCFPNIRFDIIIFHARDGSRASGKVRHEIVFYFAEVEFASALSGREPEFISS
jgi:hypothetical protein